MQKIKPAFILFIFGAVVGTGLDMFHTYSESTVYTHPLFIKAAWWTPVLFGLALLSGGLSLPFLRKKLGVKDKEVGFSKLGLCFLFFALQYYLSGFWNDETTKLPIQAGFALLVWVLFDRKPAGLFLGLITGVIGASTEIIIIHLGGFIWTKPDFLGVPYWLPFLYFTGSVFMNLLGMKLQSRNA